MNGFALKMDEEINQKEQTSTLYEELFFKLFHASGGEEICDIVNSYAVFQNRDNWYPYGGKDKNDTSNHSTFNNQQSEPVPALVEKLTNSIDSLLLRECRLKNIDPITEDAPRTMSEAVEKFFGIKNGDITESNIGELAKNIQVIATGNDNAPDLMIFDNGEGQHPDDFKNTFLSLHKNNKVNIHFVQGKYNMGSTGALIFCGDTEEIRYQLIASKLNDDLFKKQSKHKNNLFGWTLVRAKPAEDTDRAISYEYFAINGENIPSFFLTEELDIDLDNTLFHTGSIIKLYSYQLPKGCRGSIHNDLSRELNMHLYKPALPFELYDRRKKYEKNDKNSIFVKGNYFRNSEDNEDRVDGFEHCKIENGKIGKIKIQAIVLKKGKNKQQDQDRRRNFIARKPVIYTENGQLQYYLGESFITQDLGLNFIKKHLFIHIDCSEMNNTFRRGFFKANRENADKNKLEQLNDEVIKSLRGNQRLKDINEQRKQQTLSGTDDKHEKEIIKNILSNTPISKDILNMLKKNGNLKLNNPSKKHHRKTNKVQQSIPKQKRHPSIFKIKNKVDQDTIAIPLKGSKKISFETDVEDGYLSRLQEQGSLTVEVLDYKRIQPNDNPPNPGPTNLPEIKDVFNTETTDSSDGVIKLGLEPNEQQLSAGDQIKISTKLSSYDTSEGYIECVLDIRITDPQQNTQGKKDKIKNDMPDLPTIIKIIKQEDGKWVKDDGSEWDEPDWDDDSIVNIIPSNQDSEQFVEAVAINMSSNALKRYVSKENTKGEQQASIVREKYISTNYLHALFLYSIFEQLKKKEEYNQWDNEALIDNLFQEYGKVLLYINDIKPLLDSLDG